MVNVCNECGEPATYYDAGWEDENGGDPPSWWCEAHQRGVPLRASYDEDYNGDDSGPLPQYGVGS